MFTLDFPLLPHSEQYRVKNLNPDFSSFLAVVENISNWKGTQNSSFYTKNHRPFCIYIFVKKAEFMLFTGQVVRLAMSQEGTEDSTASRNRTLACSECNSDTAGTSYSSLRAKY